MRDQDRCYMAQAGQTRDRRRTDAEQTRRAEREGYITFLHVCKPLLQLVIHLRTKGKVIHKYNTAKQCSS